jgi:16S rRNA A1518/A1519 N6-dimethyltransferase RsmA/KsgA/DIM1 with predicted DNA glycosylase/AP lyase activity
MVRVDADPCVDLFVLFNADGSQYRPMTVISHYFSVPQYLFKIDRSCFFPVPKVHGALAVFRLLEEQERPVVPNERDFLIFTRQAFLSKRKKLTNSLQPKWTGNVIASALEVMGLNSQVCVRLKLLHHGHGVPGKAFRCVCGMS